MEEYELLEIAAGKKRLIDFSTPFFGRIGVEVSREVDINLPGTSPFAHTRRRPRNGIRKRLCPFPYMRIVELVRRHVALVLNGTEFSNIVMHQVEPEIIFVSIDNQFIGHRRHEWWAVLAYTVKANLHAAVFEMGRNAFNLIIQAAIAAK